MRPRASDGWHLRLGSGVISQDCASLLSAALLGGKDLWQLLHPKCLDHKIDKGACLRR